MPNTSVEGDTRSVAQGCSLYELVVRGRLGPRLVTALDGFEVVDVVDQGTRLRGWLPDQAALHARLGVVADLGMELVSVRRIDDGG
jgi:hypothetical protein